MVQFQQQMMEDDAAQGDRGEDGDNSDLEVVDVVSARVSRCIAWPMVCARAGVGAVV